MDTFHSGEPQRYPTMKDILRETIELNLVQEDSEPRSFIEVGGNSAWRAMMQQEMESVEQNKAWELADLPIGHRVITLKWKSEPLSSTSLG